MLKTRLLILSNSISFALFSYWVYWLSYDGSLILSAPLLLGLAGIFISIISISFSSNKFDIIEDLAISGVISSALTFVFWILVFGRHPYIRELTPIFLISLAFILFFQAIRRLDNSSYTKSLVLSELAIGFTFGLWFGREFEGKTRILLTIVLLLGIFLRACFSLAVDRLGVASFDLRKRISLFLVSVSMGLLAFKFDIESRAPWSNEVVFELHLASRNLMPIVISWLVSTSVVLWFVSTIEKQTSSEKNS